MRIHIIAGSPNSENINAGIIPAEQPDLIIAADGGAERCRRLGIIPHILIGDLDSISAELTEEYRHAGVEIIRHPCRKDATDLELALDLAGARGAQEAVLFGVLGGRWDMSIANVMVAAGKKYQRMRVSLLDTQCRIYIIHGGSTFTLKSVPGQTVSLIPLTADAEGVTTDGFDYPLKESLLPFSTSRGISNKLIKKEGKITVKKGLLLCIENLSLC